MMPATGEGRIAHRQNQCTQRDRRPYLTKFHQVSPLVLKQKLEADGIGFELRGLNAGQMWQDRGQAKVI
jgi:hypothetical protein